MDLDTDEPGACCRWMADHWGAPLLIACAASVVIVALAMVKVLAGGTYDPELAVLTATAVAVVWYAYWTFRVARPEAWVLLRINPDPSPALHPEVDNQINRRLWAQIILRVWIGKDPVPLGEFYRGDRSFPIEAGLSPTGVVSLQDHIDKMRNNGRDVFVAFTVEWVDDDLCEMGRTTKYWRLQTPSMAPDAIIDPKRQRDLFGPLPDPYAEDPEPSGDPGNS